MKHTKGTIVEITDNESAHEFIIGQRVEIIKVGDINYIAYNIKGDDYWWINDDECKALSE